MIAITTSSSMSVNPRFTSPILAEWHRTRNASRLAFHEEPRWNPRPEFGYLRLPTVDELPQLITFAEIEAKTLTLAEAIRRDYGDEPLLLVGVLKGSLFFLASLALKLGREVAIDFVSVSSYGDDTVSSGVVQIRKDLDINIEGRNVLLVEDIVDTGATLVHLRELLSTRHPKSLKVVSLLSKLEAKGIDVPIEYVGFEIEDRFVVGYGLDHAERYRNLPYVAVLPGEHTSD